MCPKLQASGAPCQQVWDRSQGGPVEPLLPWPLWAPLGRRRRFNFCGCSSTSGEVGETRGTHRGGHVSPGSAEATQPAPLKIPVPLLPGAPWELPVGSESPQEKCRPPDTRPRMRARLETVTGRPVTEFFPSERLSHCSRPGLVKTRTPGWGHAWTVGTLSEGLVHEKPGSGSGALPRRHPRAAGGGLKGAVGVVGWGPTLAALPGVGAWHSRGWGEV